MKNRAIHWISIHAPKNDDLDFIQTFLHQAILWLPPMSLQVPRSQVISEHFLLFSQLIIKRNFHL